MPNMTEAEIRNYVLTDKETDMVGRAGQALAGEDVEAPSINEFLALPTAQVLIPKIVIGAVRKAADPVYLASKFLKTVRMKNSGQLYVFPAIGPMRASDLAEGQEYPIQQIDWTINEGALEVRIGKNGIRVQFSQELIDEAQWDIVALSIEAAGQAMARHKEEKVFRAFTQHGWTVFDNAIRAANPEAGTTGLAEDETFNDTMSVEDFLDLIIALIANEMIPTDLVMHPLTWGSFAKSEVAGYLRTNVVYPGAPTQPKANHFALGPNSIQGRIPFGLNVSVSPFVPFDRATRRFDMYCLDRNKVGVLAVKKDLNVEEFDDPTRDIKNLKMAEYYGVGILHQGRGIAVAKNISMDTSYPKSLRVNNIGNPLPGSQSVVVNNIIEEPPL